MPQNNMIIADAHGRTDGSAYQMLQGVESRLPIVLVAWTEGFKFNEELLNIKDYILCCFCEYGHDFDLNESGTHVWGQNSEKFPRYYNGDWVKFDNWVKGNLPKNTFKRELLAKNVARGTFPIEYPSLFEVPALQPKEEFDNRLIDVFHFWGLSNPVRPKFHGDVFKFSHSYGYTVGDSIDNENLSNFIKNESGRKWLTINVPHYRRVVMDSILAINGISKLSICLPGAGYRCFRHMESPLNSVMCKVKDGLEWSKNWVHGFNCIEFDVNAFDSGVTEINEALKRDDLYDIYVQSHETMKHYQLDNYINYLKGIIDESI